MLAHRTTYYNGNDYFSVIPTVRFDWFTRSHVKLYSGLGLGVGFHNERLTSTSDGLRGKYTEWYLAPEVTFLGLAIGGRWYGFGEIVLGLDGISRAGIGYKVKGGK